MKHLHNFILAQGNCTSLPVGIECDPVLNTMLELHLVPTSKQLAGSFWHIPDAVYTVLDS
jgi:hypothetical protein